MTKLTFTLATAMIACMALLAGCTSEQTPASAARTAAALRTPASAPIANPTAGAPATLAPRQASATAQPTGQQQAQGTATPQPQAQPQPASLTASPNPVPFANGQMGTTTITWSTGQAAGGQLYVSENGDADKLFASGPSGSQDAPWIKPNHTYQFKLFAGTDHTQQLASVSVGDSSTGTLLQTSQNPPVEAAITVSPNPVPADDQELGTTMVTWTTPNGGEIYVSQDGDPEQLFAVGLRGAEEANWICRGSTYEFRLYAPNQHTDPLKVVTVTREEDAPDHEPPPVVECKAPDDQ